MTHWHLIKSDPALESVPVSDLSPADFAAELARMGNNYRKQSPRLAALLVRAAREMEEGQ